MQGRVEAHVDGAIENYLAVRVEHAWGGLMPSIIRVDINKDDPCGGYTADVGERIVVGYVDTSTAVGTSHGCQFWVQGRVGQNAGFDEMASTLDAGRYRFSALPVSWETWPSVRAVMALSPGAAALARLVARALYVGGTMVELKRDPNNE